MIKFEAEKLDTDEIELTFADYALEKIEVIEHDTYYQVKLSDVNLTRVSKQIIDSNLMYYCKSFEEAFKNALLYQMLTKIESTLPEIDTKKITCN